MGRCYNLKISPTVSLESQSSQPLTTATAANLTLRRRVVPAPANAAVFLTSSACDMWGLERKRPAFQCDGNRRRG